MRYGALKISSPEMKICTKCKLQLDIASFAADTRHADGLQSQCNSCRALRAALTREKRLITNGKICKTCRNVKSITDFSTYIGDRGIIYYYDCNSCRLILCRCNLCHQMKDREFFEIGRHECMVCRASKHMLRRHQRPLEQLLYKSAKARAKREGIPFSITIEDIKVPAICPILEIPIIRGTGRQTHNSPSLDKIDPSLGYVPGNVAVISFRANALKDNMSAKIAERIMNYILKIT
jgi:hypothetical protein